MNEAKTLVDPRLTCGILYSYEQVYFLDSTIQYGTLHNLKIVYHCMKCKKDIVDIDLAKEHSKSLHHELVEETQRAHGDNQLLI